VEIETRTIELEEKGVKLRLTVVDTPGFGDGLNSTERLNIYSFNYFILHRFFV
jgi:septin family protein